MTTENTNNPVGKLLGYMTKAADLSGNISSLYAWATVLGCKPNEPRLLVQGLGMLMELSVTARNAIETYVKGDKSPYLSPFKNIDKLLSTCSLDTPWQQYKSLLNVETMSALKFGDLALRLEFPAAQPENAAKIAELVEKLSTLLSECLKSDLNSDVKKLFVKHLEAIRKSLLDYMTGGTADLEGTVDEAIASIHRHSDLIGKSSEKGMSVVKRMVDAIGKANELVTFSQSLILVSGPTALALLPFLQG
ncbi:hypothetical protein BW686_01980 [Pseudomonas syringae]|uniref:Uncharacterized protein n=1 Tax=Pseudomonas syringae TaxID=317 RepID=A0A244EW72_PSESX|nr:hypothetical protein [Pseudomonas syringae]OUM08763.1 hypothetical protein BW686_01980 [Pseudomonas syringae]